MPAFECDACTLRLAYHSDNPHENDTSTDFFQCADITITMSKDSDSDSAATLPTPVQLPAAGVGNTPCCTEAQWESQYLSAGGADGGGYGGVSYDAKTRLMYVAQSLDADGSFEAHYINFTSGYEWRYMQDGQGKQACTLYGTDDWNDWSEHNAAQHTTKQRARSEGHPVLLSAVADLCSSFVFAFWLWFVVVFVLTRYLLLLSFVFPSSV